MKTLKQAQDEFNEACGGQGSLCGQGSLGKQKEDALKDKQIGGNHYKQFAIQPVEYNHKNKLGSIEGAVVKYVTRHKFKGGKKDLLKAIHNLEMLIEFDYPEAGEE